MPRPNNGHQDANHQPENNGTKREYLEVVTVRTRGEHKYYTKIGIAFKNEGDSFRILLEALPLDGVLLVRPPKY